MPEIRPLSKALSKKVQEELNEKPDQIDDRIIELRNWIRRQPHLKARTGIQLAILAFICYRLIKVTKTKIMNISLFFINFEQMINFWWHFYVAANTIWN